jgi:hypothetical protein
VPAAALPQPPVIEDPGHRDVHSPPPAASLQQQQLLLRWHCMHAPPITRREAYKRQALRGPAVGVEMDVRAGAGTAGANPQGLYRSRGRRWWLGVG